ncbi:sulfotransferase family protein [Parafilimonas terrae]|uniref:Sulfotransferase family protein n=1 Tax=Parafilimonas terrae TaxID=1465490 RepID=A0A1I5Z4P0_9BACT|nr:sulfotransferase [Parafilimonas terrae]SFQ51443.1 Sulfotransferase family protein [Parafilimonas terrae]
MKNANVPNFLIVGAAKGGTTSIYNYLLQHPEVFLTRIKEPCFFCFADSPPQYKIPPNTIFSFEEYKELFKNSDKYKMKGEATAIYLYLYESTIKNIKKYLPDYEDLNIIMILRNPVDRAFSQYMHNVRDMREDATFEEAIAAEKLRKEKNTNTDFFYLERGYYSEQVKAYLENFKNVKIYLFEDLISSPENLMKDLCDFLKINSSIKFNTNEKFNVSGRPKSKFLIRLVKENSVLKQFLKMIIPKKSRKKFAASVKNKVYAINLQKEKINPEIKKALKKHYREDILKLQKLINRDLSSWLK